MEASGSRDHSGEGLNACVSLMYVGLVKSGQHLHPVTFQTKMEPHRAHLQALLLYLARNIPQLIYSSDRKKNLPKTYKEW